MRRRLSLAAPVLAFVVTALGGYQMIERGSVRPGVLMVIGGIVTAVIMLRRELRKGRKEEVTKPPADGP